MFLRREHPLAFSFVTLLPIDFSRQAYFVSAAFGLVVPSLMLLFVRLSIIAPSLSLL